MKRLRAVLIGVSLCLLMALALLVSRALESIAFEREMRHRAVAERAFDEMERVLSRFLERERERPFREDSWLATAIAIAPEPPDFVLGYFQLEAGGPIQVRAARSYAEHRGDLAARIRRALDQVEHRPARRFESRYEGDALDAREMREAKKSRIESVPRAASAAAESEPSSAYDLLQKLNRATRERAEQSRYAGARRKDSVADVFPPNSMSKLALMRPQEAEFRKQAASPRAESEQVAAAEDSGDTYAQLRESSLAATSGRLARRAAPAADAHAPIDARVEIGPLVGRSAGEDQLLLYRTVLVGKEGYRQGMLIDAPALGRSLKRAVLEASGLSNQSQSFFLAPEDAHPSTAANFEYLHRFDDPFADLRIVLALDPLPDLAPSRTIYALALVASCVLLIGFFAIDRMASVVVRFAEKRNDFVASVSHELKTPLTSIRMYAEMLKDGMVEQEDKRKEYYKSITDESERLSRLIDNVLEFSRLEKGTRRLNLSASDLSPILAEAIQRLTPHVENEGFTLCSEIDPVLPRVRIDRDAILQIVFNLIDNALKYARAASRREILLRCRREDGDVILEVRDYGPGVTTPHLDHLFEPFYRGDPALIQATGGAGIGLALVKDLADAMGARIEIRSPSEGGFCIRLRFSGVPAPD